MYNTTGFKANIIEEKKFELRTISKKYRIPEEKVFELYIKLIRRGRTEETAIQIIVAALSGKTPCSQESTLTFWSLLLPCSIIL